MFAEPNVKYVDGSEIRMGDKVDLSYGLKMNL